MPETNGNSALYNHTLAFYNTLKKESKRDKNNVYVFTGVIGNVYSSLGISTSYYSTIRRSLEDSGCITLIQKGARNSPSIIALHRSPKPADLHLTAAPKAATVVEQQVKALAKNMGGIDIGKALKGIDDRLTAIEVHVGLKTKQQRSTRRK